MNRVYIGQRRQYGGFYAGGQQKGGNIFGAIGRFLRPLAKTLFNWVKPHASRAARNLGSSALQAGSRVARDVLEGRDIKASLKEQGKRGVGDFLTKQFGRGRGRRKRKRTGSSSTHVGAGKRRRQRGGGSACSGLQTGAGRRRRRGKSLRKKKKKRKSVKRLKRVQLKKGRRKKQKKKRVSFGHTIF